MSDIMANHCSQHPQHARRGARITLDQVWSHNEPYKSSYVQKTTKFTIFGQFLVLAYKMYTYEIFFFDRVAGTRSTSNFERVYMGCVTGYRTKS